MSSIFILDVSRGWILNFLRSFFMFIDCIIYSVVRTFFKTIFQLANFELTGFYEIFEERVYVILGIFMLFKVTISLITYLVNPDKITDKEQGMSKVITRVITVLVMLIALPTFFSLLTEAQNKILPVIPRVIIGTTNTLSSDDAAGIANSMSVTMLQGFAHVKDECGDNPEVSNVWELWNDINEPCTNDNNTYKYDYFPGISTIAGILMLYVLFSLCIAVAIRAFKLIILRMLAPIPVISYIDPKSSKDGAFKSWTKTLFSTWGELFMHIGLIYFIIYMIDFLLSGNAWKGFFSGVDNALEGAILLAFIVIGLLFFAKQAPQFVFDSLGIKSKGNFKRMLGMGAAALGMGGSVASSFAARNQYDQEHGKNHTLKNLGASLFSGAASGIAGGSALLSTDKPTLSTGFDAQQKYNATNLANIHSGIGILDSVKAKGTSMLFGSTPLDDMERKIQTAESQSTTAKQLKEYAIGEGKKKTAHIASNQTVDGNTYSLSLDDINAAINVANSAEGDGYVRLRDSAGNVHAYAANSSVINKLLGDAEERAGRLYSMGVSARIEFEKAQKTGDFTVFNDMKAAALSDTSLGLEEVDFNSFGTSKSFDDPGALDSFRQTLADSLGLKAVEELKTYEFEGKTINLYDDPSQIKIIEKSSQTKAFKIKNSKEYSDAQKIYKKPQK